MKTQSRKLSMLETIVNTVIGIALAFGISQLAVYYEGWIQIHIWSEFTWHLTAGSNILMVLLLTVVSMIRGYIIRRSFNNLGGDYEDSTTTKL